jgi:ABC-type amino acid transport substrate-binding protein
MKGTTMSHSIALSRRARLALLASLLALAAALPAFAAGALDKAKAGGKLSFGYAGDARPFAYADSAGKAAGYGIELCTRIGDAVKSELKLSELAIEFVALAPQEAFRAVEQGKVDLLCGAVPTLERRALVDFSIPIMLSGTSVAVRNDAPPRLVQVLSGREPVGPAWRGSPDQAPQRVVVATVGGTALEKALTSSLRERRVVADIVSVKDTAAGLQLLASGAAHAFFSDRAVLLDAVASGSRPSNVRVLDRLFRRDIVALAMHRNDDEFRLVVDRALSRLYRTADMAGIYTRHFGAPTAAALDFFQLVTLPD